MNILFDTSVLIAAFVDTHTAHGPALKRLAAARRAGDTIMVSAHSLAELYAVLTRLPLRPRIRPSTARRLIEENTRDAKIVTLSARDYYRVIARLEEADISGGVCYDALIHHAACKAKAELLLTLNPSDFNRLPATRGTPAIEEP
ncbi:PIN domain-containing protein [Kiritimatiella glycovorans]|uniref:Ribonuclease VapC n=1 Tax=Kiritimatiella glycovorans TaxID=1307763 RepID=A0A0G3EFL4_9BACT|nr:PIN domain-containing protein [Kiritimatiella glycovorans]AKJ65138.1 putative ribonuclease VapC40 [Kiritimatiella glycovorans]